MVKKEKNYLFISEPVVKDYLEYQSEENLLVHHFIREKKYTVKDTGATYRMINNWSENNILLEDYNSKESGWKKFSFTEIVWLEIVNRLRQFGISIDFIKKAKESVISRSNDENIYDWLEYHIVKTRINPLDCYLVVLSDGTSGLITSRDIETNKIFCNSRDYIAISIKNILKDFGLKVAEPETLTCLSKAEKEIIQTIRTEDFDNLSLHKKKGKIHMLDISKTTLNSDSESITAQIRENGQFAEVLTKFVDGRERSATVVKRRKFE